MFDYVFPKKLQYKVYGTHTFGSPDVTFYVHVFEPLLNSTHVACNIGFEICAKK